MRFTLPELPDQKAEDTKSTTSQTGSYDALMAKMGRIPASGQGANPDPDDGHEPNRKDRKKIFLLKPDDSDPEGYEVDPQEAAEVSAALTPAIYKVTRFAAKLISLVMVPMFMPVVSMCFLLFLTDLRIMPYADKITLLLITLAFNTVAPMLIIGGMKIIGLIKDVGLNNRRDRLLPYIIIILGLLATIFYLRAQQAPQWMWGTYAGAAVASFICCCINFWWKISAHATAAAGVIASLAVIAVTGNAVVDTHWWIFGACLLTGLMGTARVFMQRHTDLQVLAGYVCGYCSVYFTTMLLN